MKILSKLVLIFRSAMVVYVSTLWICLLAYGQNGNYTTAPLLEKIVPEKVMPSTLLTMQNPSELGDAYDPVTGSLTFAVTDIDLPGNFALPVQVRRKYMKDKELNGMTEIAGWSLDLPFIRGGYLHHDAFDHNFMKNVEGAVYRNGDGYGGGWSDGKECGGDSFGFRYNGLSAQGDTYSSSFWTGKFLHIPGEVSENLTWGAGAYNEEQATRTNHRVTECFQRSDEQGEGIVVTSPSGVRYRFEHVIEKKGSLRPWEADRQFWDVKYQRFLMATKVTDKFGNSVNYNWEGNRLQSIEASDGRKIDFNYDTNGQLSNAEANGRSWVYDKTEPGDLTVTRPDGRQWRYMGLNLRHASSLGYGGSTSAYAPYLCKNRNAPGVNRAEFYVETPEGARVDYLMDDVQHSRSNVIGFTHYPTPTFSTVGGNIAVFHNLACGYSHSLLKRTVTVGQNKYEWAYNYSENKEWYAPGPGDGTYDVSGIFVPSVNGFIAGNATPAGLPTVLPSSVPVDRKNIRTTTVTAPDGRKTVYYVDRDAYSLTENRVVAEDYYDNVPNESHLLKRVEHHYAQGEKWSEGTCEMAGGEVSQCEKGRNLVPEQHRVNLVKRVQTIYDEIGSGSDYTVENLDYDFYGLSSKSKQYNSENTLTRYVKSTVLSDIVNWVLFLPESVSVSNTDSDYTEVSRTDYVKKSVDNKYANIDVPDKNYSFGALTKTVSSYHDDGNVKKITLPDTDRWVEYVSFKRGTPTEVKTPQSLSQTPKTFYREVDDNGWLKSITDFKGYKSNITYDSIGRITGISHEDENWLPTIIDYEWQSSGAYSGMLKQTSTTGTAVNATYYDNVLRPLVNETQDTSDLGSLSYSHTRYDAFNNVIFSSYSSASAGSLAIPGLGVASEFDGLDRMIKIERDTDVGKISSKVLFKSGNKVETTDFNGHTTTSTYLAYGSPDYELTTKIDSPESVTTAMAYNMFGNLTSIQQDGKTQYNVYDSFQRLCKQVRPDIGNTSVKYNDSHYIEWTAHSASVTSSIASCDYAFDGAAKVTHTYDNLGKLRTLSYGDLSPNKTYTYDKNGNVTELVVGPFMQSYTYDDQNNLTAETHSGFGADRILQYVYNNMGYVSDVVYPTGHIVSLSPNALGQAQSIINISSGTTYVSAVDYHSSGMLKSFIYGNGLEYDLAQNTEQYPESIEFKSNSLIQVGFDYTYDDNGNIDAITDKQDASYNITMDYDGLNRLIVADGKWGKGHYNYDGTGNIKDYQLGSFSLNYNYDTNNRLDNVSGSKVYDFEYDTRGNVTRNKSGGDLFEYNLANQMTFLGNNSYDYDGHNRRVKKQGIQGVEYFAYSQAGTLMYTQKSDGSHVNYIYLGSSLVAKDTAATVNGGIVTSASLSGGSAEESDWSETSWHYKAWGTSSWVNGEPSNTSDAVYGDGSSVLESPFFTAPAAAINFDYRLFSERNGILYFNVGGIDVIIPHVYNTPEVSSLNLDVYYNGVWTNVWSVVSPQGGSAWDTANIDLSGYDGLIKLRFRGVAVSGWSGELPISDIQFVASTPIAASKDAIIKTFAILSSGALTFAIN